MEPITQPLRQEEVTLAYLIHESANYARCERLGERIVRMRKIDTILDELNDMRDKGIVIPWPLLFEIPSD
jgi:hypothetical protein